MFERPFGAAKRVLIPGAVAGAARRLPGAPGAGGLLAPGESYMPVGSPGAPMSQPPAAGTGEEAVPAEGEGDPAADEDEEHWLVDLLADVALYVMLLSLGLGILGVAGLAAQIQPMASIVLAVGSVGATGAMALAMVVAVFSGASFPVAGKSRDTLL